MRSSTLALLLPAAVSAAPYNNHLIIRRFLLAHDGKATSYCSSYLHIPTLTSTVTKTITPTSVHITVPVTVTAGPVTDTLTSTASVSTDVTVTATATATSTEVITQTVTNTLTCLYSAYTATPALPTLTPTVTFGAKRGVAHVYPKPSCIPPSWQPPIISKACSCLHLSTPCVTQTVTSTLPAGTIVVTATNTVTPHVTVTNVVTNTNTVTHTTTTTTTTTTTSAVIEEATTIQPNALRYRKYEQPYDGNLENSGYTSSWFKGKQPDWTGELSTLSFASPDWPGPDTTLTLPDHAPFDASMSALLLQGFFVARYLWTGDVAYASWDDGNAAFKASRTGAGFVGGGVELVMNEGDAIPITWLWANGGQAAQSWFAIQTPSGEVTTNTTGYFVKACSDGVFA
ncbi:GLEYA domain-containing protein [Xylariaceae sp. FL0594]|nr:GLEYA domain-containing protein [Xylariaceae sp. FL0594]